MTIPSSDVDKEVVRRPRRAWWANTLCWFICSLWWFCLMIYFWSLLLVLLLLTLPSSLNGGDEDPLYDWMLSPGLDPSKAPSQARYKKSGVNFKLKVQVTSLEMSVVVVQMLLAIEATRQIKQQTKKKTHLDAVNLANMRDSLKPKQRCTHPFRLRQTSNHARPGCRKYDACEICK